MRMRRRALVFSAAAALPFLDNIGRERYLRETGQAAPKKGRGQ